MCTIHLVIIIFVQGFSLFNFVYLILVLVFVFGFCFYSHLYSSHLVDGSIVTICGCVCVCLHAPTDNQRYYEYGWSLITYYNHFLTYTPIILYFVPPFLLKTFTFSSFLPFCHQCKYSYAFFSSTSPFS